MLWGPWGSISGTSSVRVLMSSMWQNILISLSDFQICYSTWSQCSGLDFWLKKLFMGHIWEDQEPAGQGILQHCRKISNVLGWHRRWCEEGTVWSWREAKPWWRHCQHSSAGSDQLSVYIPGDYPQGVTSGAASADWKDWLQQRYQGNLPAAAWGRDPERGPASDKDGFHTLSWTSSWRMSLFGSEHVRPSSSSAAKHLQVLSVPRNEVLCSVSRDNLGGFE